MWSIFWIVTIYELVQMTVIGYVHIENQMDNKVVNLGEDVEFVCDPIHSIVKQDPSQLKIRWKHDGEYIDFSSSQKYHFFKDRNTLLINRATSKEAGVYTCVASVGFDMDMTSAHLTVRTAPDPPTDVQIVRCQGLSVEIVWMPGKNNGDPVTGYILQFNSSDNPNEWYKNYYDEIPGLARTIIKHLPPFGTYSFRVLAKNSIGLSAPSAPTRDKCTSPPNPPDTNPQNVHTVTDTKGKLIIEWEPMPRLMHHGSSFHYLVYWRPKGSVYWNSKVVNNANANRLEVDVNDTYGFYEIKVKARNSMGEAYQPAYIYVGHSGEDEPIVVPKDFRIDPLHPVTAHTAHFIWEAVETSPSKIKGKFRGYKIRYWKSSEGRHKSKEVDIFTDDQGGRHGPDVRAAISDLPSYTPLRAQVAVINTHHSGPPSQTIDFFTPEGVPGPVRDLSVESRGATFVILKWNPPDEPNGILIGYVIGYQSVKKNNLGPLMPLKPQLVDRSTVKIFLLEPKGEYRFFVWARTKAGKGTPKFIDVKTLSEMRAPTPIPQVTHVFGHGVNLTWPVDKGTLLDYYLEYRKLGDNDTWQASNAIGKMPWTFIHGLTPESTYEIRGVSKNKRGDTATSSVLMITTAKGGGESSYYTSANGGLLQSLGTMGGKKNEGVRQGQTLSPCLFLTILLLTSYLSSNSGL